MHKPIGLLDIQLKARRFKPSDYQILCKWWSDWKKPIIPYESLPEIGLIVENIGAVFLYKTDSNIALVENLITNKFYKEKNRNETINMLIEEILVIARKLGFKHVFSGSENQFVFKRFSHHNYKELKSFKLFYKEI